jgi:hypothetical protein
MQWVPGINPWGVKQTTYLYLVPRSVKVELSLHSPVYLHGVVLNELSIGTTLSLFLKAFTN